MTHYDEDKESFRCEHGKVRGGTSWPCEVCGRAELTQLRADNARAAKRPLQVVCERCGTSTYRWPDQSLWCEICSHGLISRLTAQRDRLLAAAKRALNYGENVAKSEGVYFDEDGDLEAIQRAIAECEGKP